MVVMVVVVVSATIFSVLNPRPYTAVGPMVKVLCLSPFTASVLASGGAVASTV